MKLKQSIAFILLIALTIGLMFVPVATFKDGTVDSLNAEITKLLFKDKFTLALKAYDILGQSKNLSVSDSANYHTETRNNTLGRYVILSLTYRFGTFGGGGGRGPGGPMGGPYRR